MNQNWTLSEIAKNRAPLHHHHNAVIDTDLGLRDTDHLTEVVIEHLEVIVTGQIDQTRPIEDEIGKICYIGVGNMLLRFFERISFSRTSSNGTYRYEK